MTVTGNRADEEVKLCSVVEFLKMSVFCAHVLMFPCIFCSMQTIDRLIETGDSEQIFQKAIREQGRGQVCSCSAVCAIFFCQ